MRAYGIPLPEIKLAGSEAEAIELSRQIGFPVALKIACTDIPHKSDVGGVILNLLYVNAVSDGYTQLIARTRAARPQADIQGVYVQRMITGGQEVIVGAIQDQQFGPLAMFGSGGVEVEGVKDVAFALAPMTTEETDFLLQSTWAGQRLRGFRNLAPADRQAAKVVLLLLAQLAADFPQIAEIEINPLIVLQRGQGAYAIDARARLA